MKLLSRVVLVFSEGKSDKVFEIDLCDAGGDKRLVNYRYGKRGAVLKESTKTVSPVSVVEADRLVAALIDAKIEQGYQREALGASAPQPAQGKATTTTTQPAASAQPKPSLQDRTGGLSSAHHFEQSKRAPSILRHLTTPRARSGRRLDRIIWQAGELRLQAAEEPLLRLVNGQPLRDYCVAWALGRCGSARSQPLLMQLYGSSPHENVRRIACEALLRLSDEDTRQQFQQSQIAQLPKELQPLAQTGPASAFSAALQAHLTAHNPSAVSFYELLYRINNEHVRPALLAFVRDTALEVPAFRVLRHLFKMAEYRTDGELFGLLAYRFEKRIASYQSSWNNPDPEAANGKCAYGSRTRSYLRRRVWRTLRRLGTLADPDYVPLATGVLLPYRDADAVPERHVRMRRNLERLYGPFAPYFAFNHILFAKVPGLRFTRLIAHQRGTDLRARTPMLAAREEAFPALWDAHPHGLLHLLDESACEPVHVFASKALRANQTFFATLDADVAKMLLARPYEVTAHLGFELARKLYDPMAPDMGLLFAVATGASAQAREWGLVWLGEQRERLLEESSMTASLATSQHASLRAFVHALLVSASLAPQRAEALVGRILALTMALGAGSEAIVTDVTQLLLGPLASTARQLSVEILDDLLGHSEASVRTLAAQLVLLQEGTPPDDIMLRLLSDTSALPRQVGLRLLGQMPEAELAQRYMLLVRLSTHRHEDLRQSSRALIRRVATASHALGEEIGHALIAALLRRKLPDGAAAHVVRVLSEDLPSLLAELNAETIWRLLQSDGAEAQSVGSVALLRTGLVRDLSVEQLAKLSNHELRAVREASWEGFETNAARVRAHLLDAIRILDAKWDDSRAYGFRFFRERLTSEDFTPSLLVAICDSVRPDVQAFGREMISAHFRDEDGPELLAHLSEHPAPSLQLYTSSFLDRFASGRPGRIEQLVPYFHSALARPNKGRVSKQRVLAFLRREGLDNSVTAELALGVLHRLSATCAIEYRALAIEAMVAIHHAFPALTVPLIIQQPTVRERPRASVQSTPS